jgi:hypothetical protein
MKLLDRDSPVEGASPGMDADALIREAKQRERRRRIGLGLATLLVIAAVGTTIGVLSTTGQHKTTFEAPDNSGLLPTGRGVPLELAGSLAVGPTGALYVAAPLQHQILVRLRNGTFRVIAGTGNPGLSGDGAPAVDAKLSKPYDLTFGPNGELYFADKGRIRVIRTDGVIETIAGNGIDSGLLPGANSPRVTNGTLARSASLGSDPFFAIGTNGEFVVTTENQLLRLVDGRFFQIPTHRVSFGKLSGMPTSIDSGLGTIAIDEHGDIDVTGFNGWAVWRIEPNGDAYYLGYARQSGGNYAYLVNGPGHSVYADAGPTIVRLAQSKLVAAYSFAKLRLKSEYFSLTSFAFGPGGVVYGDELPGHQGFEAYQQLVAREARHTYLLWQESKKVAGSSGDFFSP